MNNLLTIEEIMEDVARFEAENPGVRLVCLNLPRLPGKPLESNEYTLEVQNYMGESNG